MTFRKVKPNFSDTAEQLVDNGYNPLPLAVAAKHPILKDWTNQDLANPKVVEHLIEAYSSAGVGLRCGSLVVLDIDVKDSAGRQCSFLDQRRRA